MTNQSIEVFLTVVRTGSISAAAQALYITQPAVSRRIRELEEEVGCPLLRRGKGVRRVELTDQGEKFIEVARKWRSLWRETRELAGRDRNSRLSISSVGSVSTYLLPPAFRSFLQTYPDCAFTFHNYHSEEAYHYIDSGLLDLALISDDMYFKGVETMPAFREPMVLLVPRKAGYPEQLHPSQLDPGREIRLPWNPEYDLWHGFWFSASASPRAVLDQMTLLEDFFSWGDSWAIMPISAARGIARRQEVSIHRLEDGPPDRFIYYLQSRQRRPEMTDAFLACLKQVLGDCPGIECFL